MSGHPREGAIPNFEATARTTGLTVAGRSEEPEPIGVGQHLFERSVIELAAIVDLGCIDGHGHLLGSVKARPLRHVPVFHAGSAYRMLKSARKSF